MKIARIETFVVEANVASWVLLRLYTDDGLTGLGDCTLESKEHTVLGTLQDVAPSCSARTRGASSGCGRSSTGARRGRGWACSPP